MAADPAALEVNLRQYLEALLAEKDRRDVQRYEAQTKALDAAFLANQTAMQVALATADTAVNAALAAAKEAVATAQAHAEKRFDEVSKVQAGIIEQAPRITQITERIEALDRLTDAKFVTFRTLIDSQAEKVALALASSDKAVSKAEAATEKRFESVNEFRGTLSDQASTFISRVEFHTVRDTLVERVQELATRVADRESRGAGLHAGWIYLLGALAAMGAIVSLIVLVR